MKHLFILLFSLALCPLLLAAGRPNIVLVMADDQGWGDTGYNGHPELKTPNLDALAKSGLRLNRFYTAHFNCSPTRASVMTGRHPHRMGTFSPGSPIRAQELTVAKVLQSAGYATGHFGKWHLNGKNGDKNTTAIPGRAILAERSALARQAGLRRMGLRRQLLRSRSGPRPQRRAGEVSRRQLGHHHRRGAEVHPQAGRRGQAVPRRRVVRLAARAARGAAGGQGGLRRAAGEGSELLRRNHRRGSQRGPAARGACAS